MKKTGRSYFACTLFFLLLLSPSLHAAPQNAEKPFVPESSFEDWLKNYEAWDKLEQVYAQKKQDAPEDALERAKVYLTLGNPKDALEVLEMTPAFADNATEAQRLWYGGEAHRALGDITRAAFWYTQSAKFMDDSAIKKSFESQPGLDAIWQDVWRKQFWAYNANFTMSRGTSLEMLGNLLDLGNKVWAKSSFWNYANAAYQTATGNATAYTEFLAELDGTDKNAWPESAIEIPTSDTNLISKALAKASLEQFIGAEQDISALSNNATRAFWDSVITFIKDGSLPTDLAIYENNNLFKARAFWSGNLLAPFVGKQAEWLLGNPDSEPWQKFRNRIASLPVEQAMASIDAELKSMLISESTLALLREFRLAYTIAEGTPEEAREIWNTVDKSQLCLSLRLAGVLMFDEPVQNILNSDRPAETMSYLSPLLTLINAAGVGETLSSQAPFWMPIPEAKLADASRKRWPLDELILLAHWQKMLNEQPEQSLAKRGAFLFDNTSFGANCLIYLSDQAVMDKDVPLAAFYMNRLTGQFLTGAQQAKLLEIKTRLQLIAGKTDGALSSYEELSKLNYPIPSMTTLRIALILQQRGELKKADEYLQSLWSKRDTLSEAMQAEVLFWIAEGQQALRLKDQALDNYLLLAWRYPAQSIWALTAMYRASVIYESRGRYDTAKRLLQTVIKNADTKEQREAAKARLGAIEDKAGDKKKSAKKKGTLVFPF